MQQEGGNLRQIGGQPIAPEPSFNHQRTMKTNRAKVTRIQISPELSKKILDRDGHFCACCGATERLAIDHIVPVHFGGTNDEDNLQPLCTSCNSTKGDHASVIEDGKFYLIGNNGRHSVPMIELYKARRIEAARRNLSIMDYREGKEEEGRRESRAGHNWISDQLSEVARKKAF